MVSIKTAALVATAIIGGADAFWRMPCRSRTGLARLDPLVAPGTLSDHSHAIHGGNNFGMNTKATELKNSQCTSCAVTQDKSAYWTPSLHFMYPNGTTVVVPQIGGMLAYYLLYGNNYDGVGKITAFPDGFQMLAGDMNLRNFSNLPVPDPPTYQWTPEQMTQPALRQKALGFNCMNYQRPGEPTLYRHFMPEKSYLDANCANGLRLELMFPSCWNGKDLDTPDHKSHVAYPDFVMTGKCPPGFDVKLPSLLYETIWDTNAFNGVDGQFMLSYGDPTGYGYHGDFMMGWDSVDLLQQACDQCTDLSGDIQKCSVFDIQTDYSASECKFEEPDIIKDDNVAGPRDGLAQNVPIQAGPGYAERYNLVGAGDATTSTGSTSIPTPSSVPELPYTPAPSSTDLPIPITPASVEPPATTAPPSDVPVNPASTLNIIGTSYITKPNEVIELVIVQAYTTVTEGIPVAAAEATPNSMRVKRHLAAHKRHGH